MAGSNPVRRIIKASVFTQEFFLFKILSLCQFLLVGQMSSFKFLFFGWLFASQKKREMHSISRPEFASQTRAF